MQTSLKNFLKMSRSTHKYLFSNRMICGLLSVNVRICMMLWADKCLQLSHRSVQKKIHELVWHITTYFNIYSHVNKESEHNFP